LRWTRDREKARANRAKHGLSFETAVHVFDDPFHASKPDLIPTAIDGGRSGSSGRRCDNVRADAAAHSQTIKKARSNDGLAWRDMGYVVASDIQSDRPVCP